MPDGHDVLASDPGPYTNPGTDHGTDYGIYAGADPAHKPLVINNDGQATGDANDGIFSARMTTVVNTGMVTGSDGVVITQGGRVDNTNTITGRDGTGVAISGGRGRVTNAAGNRISGVNAAVTLSTDTGAVINTGGTLESSANSSTAVSLNAGGMVTNAAGGLISGGSGGVYVGDGLGAAQADSVVENAGRIVGFGGTAVEITTGGRVTNNNSIRGANGVSIEGKGTVSNTMTITATVGTGVSIGDGGTVTNEDGASITGVNGGLSVDRASATVDNYGTISSSAASSTALALGEGGIVTNGFGASIGGGANGIAAEAGSLGVSPTTVTNLGSITGTGGTAVSIAGPGVVTNLNTMSGANGVNIDQVGTVTNAHRIEATVGTGVSIGKGGAVTNAPLASISGTQGGVSIERLPGVVTNAGTIEATGASGTAIMLGAGGAVVNSGTGTISGGANGIAAEAGALGNAATRVTNAGSITGTGGTAVSIAGPGSVRNSGSISGANGISIEQKGTVANSDTIAATTGIAISIDGGGSVGNGSGNAITGVDGGITIDRGAGTVSNAGTISASGASGTAVMLGDGGSVTNAAGATVKGGSNGISAEAGDDGTALTNVVNAGAITGTGGTAVSIAAGSVGNLGTISGATGISIGGAGTVANSSKITATSGIAVSIGEGGSVSNAAGASISGVQAGVSVGREAATLTNGGSITASGASGFGVELAAGGTVENAAGAVISGKSCGLTAESGDDGMRPTTIIDHGTISGSTAVSVAGPATIVDAGAIKSTRGNAGTAVALGSTGSTFVLERGAILVGGISGFDEGDVLEIGVVAAVDGYTTSAGPSGMTALSLTRHGRDVVTLDLIGNYVGDAFTLHGVPGTDEVSVTLGGARDTVSVATFDRYRASLDKRPDGFSIADTAAVIKGDLANIVADASHINSIASTTGVIVVSAATFASDRDALAKVIGGVTVYGTSDDIKSDLGLIKANIGRIRSVDVTSGTINVSAATFEADRAALDLAGTFTITDTAAHVSAHLADIQSDIGHVGAIKVTSGTVVTSDASFKADRTALDKIGRFIVQDSASNIRADLAALLADNRHIAGLSITDQILPVGAALLQRDAALLDKVSGGVEILDSTANIAASFDALEADVAHIRSVAFSGAATLELKITTAQASADKTLLGRIDEPYVLDVVNANGYTTTTGHGDGLTIHAATHGGNKIEGGGTSENFVFGKTFDKDSIADFYQHISGPAHDTITLQKSDFADFVTVLHDASSTSSGTTLTAANGDTLYLAHVTATALQGAKADFKFV